MPRTRTNRTQIFESIVKFGIGHANFQLFEHIGIARIEVETHLREPFKVSCIANTLLDQRTGAITFVNVFDDLPREEEEERRSRSEWMI